MRGEGRVGVTALYLCSLFSGAAALAYEIAWTKLLSLTFGSTTLAASATLAGFMGGMGIGAFWYHRVLRRHGSPLLLYALLEIAIAATAFGVTFVFPVLPGLFANSAGPLGSGVPLVLARYACAFLVLAIPTALMGATFPALCAALIKSQSGVGRYLGMLYGLNTLGAAIGALLAGLVLIDAVGLRATVWLGNALNLLVALAAFALARRRPDVPATEGALPGAPAAFASSIPRQFVAIALLLSGFATFGYEILWFRALRYLFGNSTYAFTIMLVVFLSGLGIGGLAFRRVSRLPRADLALGLVQLSIGVLVLFAISVCATILGTPNLESQLSVFSPTLASLPWWQRLFIQSLAGFFIMLPATLMMGLAFPLASGLFIGDAQDEREVSQRVGGAVLLSNLGSIVGALVAAMLLLPLAGTVFGTLILALINSLVGIVVLSFVPASLRFVTVAAVASFAAFAGFALILPERLSFVGAGNQEQLPASALIFEREGDLATVQVWRSLNPPALGMAIDGSIIGATANWHSRMTKKQLLLAHLPMFVDGSLKTTLNIGLGSSSTLRALSDYPGVEVLDAVEINDAVVEATMLFPESSVLSDPRSRVIVDDVLHFLLRHPGHYDLIVSDGKQARGYSGNAKLLSSEFYALTRRRLTERGMLVQWIPLDTAGDFPTVLRTFAESFTHSAAYFFPPGTMLMVGSERPLDGRVPLAEAVFRSLPVRAELEPFGLGSGAALRGSRVAGREALLAVAGSAPLNTWDHPVLEFAAFRAPEAGGIRLANCLLLLDARRAEEAMGREPAVTPELRSNAVYHEAVCSLFRGDTARALSLSQRAVAIDPGNGGANSLVLSLLQAE